MNHSSVSSVIAIKSQTCDSVSAAGCIEKFFSTLPLLLPVSPEGAVAFRPLKHRAVKKSGFSPGPFNLWPQGPSDTLIPPKENP